MGILIGIVVTLGAAALTGWYFSVKPEEVGAAVVEKLGQFAPLIDGVTQLGVEVKGKLLDMLFKVIPESWVPSFGELFKYVGFVDFFLCLEFAVVLIFLRYTILGVIYFLRFVKSFVPFLS